MYTRQQQLTYARQLQRLHELYVIKSNIHLTYKYKNRNKAIAHAQSLQDKIINAIIDDAVYGNSNKIRNIDSTIEKLMTTTLENERKRIHHKPDRYVDRAVELNAERYSQILSNRINTEAIKLERKIESELASGIHNSLSETQIKKALQEKYGDTAKARIKNIIKDSIHTNESNISFINALNEGYNYKVWMNGRGKGQVREWHKARYISPVPIDEYFRIHGPKGLKELMYPGDLYGGAENVANCRCWLRYTNREPERLGQKQTVFNIPPSSYMNPQNKPVSTANNVSGIRKPIEQIMTSISNTTKKVTSKIKNIGGKITGRFRKQKVSSTKHDPKKKTKNNKGSKFGKISSVLMSLPSKGVSNKPKNKKHKLKKDKNKYVEYSKSQANAICDEYVLIQGFYTNNFYKRIIDKWSTSFFKELNSYIRGIIIPPSTRLKDLENYRRILSQLINSTSGLRRSTKLFRGEKEVDLSRFVVGEENEFEGFIGTSFYRKVGKNFRINSKKSFLIEINAKTGTKGIAINGKQLGKFKNQYEWLLNDGQRYITRKVDIKNRVIVIDLL